MSLESFLEALDEDPDEVPVSDFIEASGLLPEELITFARAWFGFTVENQRWIITTMVELAEDSTELDFSTVFRMCLKDKDEEVLEKAIEGLWEDEDRSIIPGLIQILHSEKSPQVRAAAAVALGKFPALLQEGKLMAKDGDSILESLMTILKDSGQPSEVVRRSMEAAAPFNTPDIRKFVNGAYKGDDLLLKCSSLFAMGRTGEVKMLPVLIKEMRNSEPSIRYESAHACGELGEEDAVPHLVGLLEDDDTQVQLAGISAMGKIGGPLAKKILVNCVKEGDAVLEEAARTELENIEFMEDPMAFGSEI